MFDVDIIIPCYGPSSIINKGLAVLAAQWKKEFIHVILVDDCSPNTDCHYQDLVDIYKPMGLDVKVVVSDKNQGQGLTRQLGIDSSTHDWIMFQDEDDMYASPITISQFVGQVEIHGLHVQPDGSIDLDANGEPIRDDLPEVALVSGSVFEWDDSHVHTIPSYNQVWMNSKLYNKKFLKKHEIVFNERQSRHAEDYFFTKCLFLALEMDPEYCALMLDDSIPWYFWYPNQNSQSRSDKYYGQMLSGYTMDGSLNVLKFLKKHKKNFDKEKFTPLYNKELLNMTVYSFYTFMDFINTVALTDFKPTEQDWCYLRDACCELASMCNKRPYKYMEKVEELVHVKEFSDVHYNIPWMSFDRYISGSHEYFKWEYQDLMSKAKSFIFEEGLRKIEKNGELYFEG